MCVIVDEEFHDHTVVCGFRKKIPCPNTFAQYCIPVNGKIMFLIKIFVSCPVIVRYASEE